MTIYKSFLEAKNGTHIPVFLNGHTMESRYNPEHDAENLLNSITEPADFFLILGIGSGIFLKLLSQKFPSARIIGFELFDEDIAFLKQSKIISNLQKNSSLSFASLNNIETVLSQTYLPARDGNLKIIEQRAWVNENSEYIPKINEVLQKTLGVISADYSVQAHFGKLWNSNILNNTLLSEKIQGNTVGLFEETALKKTAVIVAAGPSLDKTIKKISEHGQRDNYFIFSTDTAAQSLIKQGIIPEVIVSIDGQAVSYNHFINSAGGYESSSIYAFDLCANASAARYLYETGNRLFFFCSGHPLSSAINISSGTPLPSLFSGAGTVTITALDLAVQSGFKDIMILGADFSYLNGKAYASGTYLDTLYNQSSNKLSKTEQTFSKLMFRTELKNISNEIKTTQILEAYRYSLEKYLENQNISFTKQDDIYILKNQNHCKSVPKGIFSISDKKLSLENFMKKLQSSSIEEAETLLLPYVAWLRNNPKYSEYSYSELLKLALESIVSYNR